MTDPTTQWKREASAANRKAVKVDAHSQVVILASRFNEPLVENLVQGAVSTFEQAGLSKENIRVIWGPGSFELSGMAAQVARCANPPHAIVALGVLIQGQTVQYEVIAQAVAFGLTQVSVQYGVPVTFGVVIASNLEQARARCGQDENRGEEAAHAALSVLASGCDGESR